MTIFVTFLMKQGGLLALNSTLFSQDLNQAIGSLCRLSALALTRFVFIFLDEWRVVYIARFQEAVYVLHAFQKKTRKTRQQDLDLARQRYKQIGG